MPTRQIRIALAIAVSALLFAVFGCGGARSTTGATAPSERQCQPPEETVRTLVVDFEPADRAALETDAPGGVFVVRYDGCALELLDDCLLTGEYVPKAAARSTGGFTVRGDDEIEERLPLGAVAIESDVAEGAPVTLEYVTAATAMARLSSKTRGMLSGRCDRATHFIRTLVRGAYRMSAGNGPNAKVIRDGGDYARCSARTTEASDTACLAVVQVVLTPVSELTASRDDLYDDLGSEVMGIASMEETMRALQQMAQGAPGAAPPAAGIVPPEATGATSAVSKSILAVPEGGSDAWDKAVTPIIVGAFDKNGSTRIDTAEEVGGIPCEVLATLDRAIKSGRGGVSALRTTYGFPRDYIWVGYALGFDEKVRPDADARLANCGL